MEAMVSNVKAIVHGAATRRKLISLVFVVASLIVALIVAVPMVPQMMLSSLEGLLWSLGRSISVVLTWVAITLVMHMVPMPPSLAPATPVLPATPTKISSPPPCPLPLLFPFPFPTPLLLFPFPTRRAIQRRRFILLLLAAARSN